jgi:ABC-type polysaccharide/polyol phosphate export permease
MLNRLLKPILESLPENNWLERLWMMAKVDFWKRYYNNKLGVFWAFLNPLLSFAIYYLFFTVIYQNRIEGFAFYLFSGMLIWQFFSEGTNSGIRVFHLKSYLIQSIQINTFDLNLANCLTAFFAYIFNMGVFLILQFFFGPEFTWNIIYFIPIIFISFIIVLGVSSILSAAYLYFKDMEHLWSVILRAGFFMHPILYDKDLIFEHAPFAMWVSPMVGILINAREVIVYGNAPDFLVLGYDLLYGLVLLAIGYLLSKRVSQIILEKL